MRLLLELAAVFFAITTIYRRLIQPFIDGMRSGRTKKAETGFRTAPPKRNIDHPDPKQIQDAEFEEIK